MVYQDALYTQRRMGGYDRVVRLIRKNMQNNHIIPVSQYAYLLDITEDQTYEVEDLIQQHPDWDDSQIADEMYW